MITVIPRILSMAQPMATSFPVTGMELISSTEFFLDSFRPSPQGTIWFPQMCATRINEKKGLIQPSGTKLLLTHDNVSELEFTKTLMFLDAGRILIEKGYRLLKATLQDHPLAATV